MKKNSREIALSVVAILIAATFSIFIITSGGFKFALKTFIIIVAILAVAVFYLRNQVKKRKDIKNGIQVEDELTEMASLFAGKKAYMLSMYIWLFIYVSNTYFADMNELIGFGILSSASIYGICLWRYRSTAGFNEK